MSRDWSIREEAPGDEGAIAAVTAAAFADHPHSSGSEPRIIERLRERGELALSLVAQTASGEIVGHIAFSPVTIGDTRQGWFGLGPLSADPVRKGEGIGSALVTRGIEVLRERGAAGCAVVGDPGYYARFGFARPDAISYPGPLDPYLQVMVLDGPAAGGVIVYSPAYG